MSLTIQIWELFFSNLTIISDHPFLMWGLSYNIPSLQPIANELWLIHAHRTFQSRGSFQATKINKNMPMNFSLLTYCWLSHLKEYL